VQVLSRLDPIPVNAGGCILWEQVAAMSGGLLKYAGAADGKRYGRRLCMARAHGSVGTRERIAEIDKKIKLLKVEKQKIGKQREMEQKIGKQREMEHVSAMSFTELLPLLAEYWGESVGGAKMVKMGSTYVNLSTGAVFEGKAPGSTIASRVHDGKPPFQYRTSPQVLNVMRYIASRPRDEQAGLYADSGLSEVLSSEYETIEWVGSDLGCVLYLARELDVSVRNRIKREPMLLTMVTGAAAPGRKAQAFSRAILDAIPDLQCTDVLIRFMLGGFREGLERLIDSKVCGRCIHGNDACGMCTDCNLALCAACAAAHVNDLRYSHHNIASDTDGLVKPACTFCPEQAEYGESLRPPPMVLYPLSKKHADRGLPDNDVDYVGQLYFFEIMAGAAPLLLPHIYQYLVKKLGLFNGPMKDVSWSFVILRAGNPLMSHAKRCGGTLRMARVPFILSVDSRHTNTDPTIVTGTLLHPGAPRRDCILVDKKEAMTARRSGGVAD